MVGRIWCYLLAISLNTIAFVHAAKYDYDYGVGFELSLDYGVASIYFSNGSNVDVVKIEGSPAYKQIMRTMEAKETAIYDGMLIASVIAAQAPLGLQSLRDYLPPWLGGHHNHTSLWWMLRGLKIATESYLEAPVSTAEVALEFPASDAFFNLLRSTASSLSIQMPVTRLSPAGMLAARAYNIGGECDLFSYQGDPPQLFLTVEYTRAALTALLVFEECQYYEDRRILHDTRLGANSLSEESSADRQAKLASSLQEFTKLPLDDGNGSELEWISSVVLLGESAGDPLLHNVLKDVLREQLSDGPVTAKVDGQHKVPIDLAFAAARGVAWHCWDQLNFPE